MKPRPRPATLYVHGLGRQRYTVPTSAGHVVFSRSLSSEFWVLTSELLSSELPMRTYPCVHANGYMSACPCVHGHMPVATCPHAHAYMPTCPWVHAHMPATKSYIFRENDSFPRPRPATLHIFHPPNARNARNVRRRTRTDMADSLISPDLSGPAPLD